MPESASRGVSTPGGGCLLLGGCLLGGVYSGGCLLPEGGVCSQGVSALGGVCSGGGVCSRGSAPRGCLLLGGCLFLGGVVSQHALRQTPPPVNRITHIPVKTLPWPNFVAAGKNMLIYFCVKYAVLSRCHF